jgi:hypothetical protein
VIRWLAVLTLAAQLSTDASALRPIRRAAPEILIIFGHSLAQPIIVRDWQRNHRLLLNTPTSNFAKPPRDWRELNLALFWGVEWRDRDTDARGVAHLLTLARSGDSNTYSGRLTYPELRSIQSGRLYIDPSGTRAVVALRGNHNNWIGGEVGADGVELLRASGVLDAKRRVGADGATTGRLANTN